MITPRTTRLHRAADLRAFNEAIRRLTDHRELSRLRDCAVIVPSSAAADQLRRGFEDAALGERRDEAAAVALPLIVTRAGWYGLMHERLAFGPRRLSELEREVILASAARAADACTPAPFRLRAGLLVAMLSFYDDLRRRSVTVDRFEAAMIDDLSRDVDHDRGAERLLRQTKFLAASFRGYEATVLDSGAIDEHGLRELLVRTAAARPLRQVVVTVGDRVGDPAGLWKADFDLLTRLPALERIDVVATRAALSSGLLDRLHDLLPGFEDETVPGSAIAVTEEHRAPIVPAVVVVRDREEELAAVARRLRRSRPEALDRCAVIFKRPLPYVYLARDVLARAGVPYQTRDALPLASEPYAAALDLLFEAVLADFAREPLVALLSSPFFRFEGGGCAVGPLEAYELDRALCDGRYFGGRDQLGRFAADRDPRVRQAASAALLAVDRLDPLRAPAPASEQLGRILAFLEAHERMPSGTAAERHLRARSAIQGAIRRLARAHEQFGNAEVDMAGLAATLRRWMEGQTFAPPSGAPGVQLLDAQAARYGEFDEVTLVGLIEGEWPERVPGNIFYPQSLLARFESAADEPGSVGPRASIAAERAAFEDFLALPGRSLVLSTLRAGERLDCRSERVPPGHRPAAAASGRCCGERTGGR